MIYMTIGEILERQDGSAFVAREGEGWVCGVRMIDATGHSLLTLYVRKASGETRQFGSMNKAMSHMIEREGCKTVRVYTQCLPGVSADEEAEPAAVAPVAATVTPVAATKEDEPNPPASALPPDRPDDEDDANVSPWQGLTHPTQNGDPF